jgi:raffinose/stachyose/melibiose transport system permease protein
MSKFLKWFVLILFLIYALLPFVMISFTSLKTEKELYRNIIGPPTKLHFENFRQVWIGEQFWKYFRNTLIIAVPNIVLIVLIATLAGYSLSKLHFTGKNIFFYMFLIGIMLPIPSVMIPIYFNFAKLNLLDTYWGIILAQIGVDLPFGIFLMRTFFTDIPSELLESARIDGSSELRILYRIIFPLAKPGILALCLIEFMWSWQSYLIPLFINTKEAVKPLTVAIDLFEGRYSTTYTLIAAASVIVILPIIIVFLLTQKSFIRGLIMGALK